MARVTAFHSAIVLRRWRWIWNAERFERAGTKRLRKVEKMETKRCRLPGERKPCIVRSAFAAARGTLGPVVEAPVRAVLDIRHDLPFRRTIGTQLVGDDALWRQALFLQQPGEQAPGGLGIAAVLDDLVDISVLIDSPPQPMFLAAMVMRSRVARGNFTPRLSQIRT